MQCVVVFRVEGKTNFSLFTKISLYFLDENAQTFNELPAPVINEGWF
jgi:hypothetical protein